MKRKVGVLVLCSVVVSGRAFADEEPQASCETVTTVRCTGSAAPLALPAPTAPAPLPPPPPPEPPCCEPARAVAPIALPGGWKLVHSDGRLMLERKKKTGIAGVWAPGMVLWLASWTGLSAGGALDERPWAAAPLVGGFIAGGIDLADGNLGKGFGYAAGGVLQVAGFVTFLVGVSAGEKLERMPLEVAPLALRDGGGASLRVRF